MDFLRDSESQPWMNFKILSQNKVIDRNKAESTNFVESMITKNKDEGQNENNEDSPNTSAESDDVFIVEKVVEDNSEA